MMHEVADPLDALYLLEGHVRRLDFNVRWQTFLRQCALLLLPGLPPESQQWVSVADEYEAGRLPLDGLNSARVRAWEFHNARPDTTPAAELSGLRIVMYRLWPPDTPDRWYESAMYFLEFCDEAGLRSEQWWPLLHRQFGDILDGRSLCRRLLSFLTR